MNITQAVKMAAKSIAANKGRSALTMLGIIIGLAAVIILVSYAQGQNLAMERYYESIGTNKINIYASTWQGGVDVSRSLYDYCLTLDDLVMGVTPNSQVSAYPQPAVKYGAKALIGDSYETYPTIYMGSDQFGLCNNYTIAKGRDITHLEVDKGIQVCVLGAGTAEALFNQVDPVGKTITIGQYPFLVVGVYERKGSPVTDETDYTQISLNYMDRMILVPSSMNRIFNQNRAPDQFVVKAKDSKSTTEAITRITGFLKGIISSNYGSFSVTTDNTWQEQDNKANELQQRFLGGIAAISLLVGGIGIMNIMLVTVTERTREIGIRKAIGAERRSIIIQFLIEAAMICGIGGIFGIAAGYVGTLIVGKMSFDTILIPSPEITAGAFAISVALGIIFGLYPAAKASRLQPVEALRAE